MNRTILTLLSASLSPLLCMAEVHAQPSAGPPGDPSRLQESGPAVVGGTGATAGPNSKNQAITPMPGMEQELSERPPDAALRPLPDVRPAPGAPRSAPKATTVPR